MKDAGSNEVVFNTCKCSELEPIEENARSAEDISGHTINVKSIFHEFAHVQFEKCN